MDFFKFIPYGSKEPTDMTTLGHKEVQIWQELTMLRHITGPNKIFYPKTTAPYIDQAKVYFLDAIKSNWRTAGLLYYYSFLNLAKAFLVTNKSVSGKLLKSLSIYHGLSEVPHDYKNIINYEIKIHMPGSDGNIQNIFAAFYQELIKEKWPFTTPVIIKISDVISYCQEISHEVYDFYKIQRATTEVLSVVRVEPKNSWFEMLVFKDNNFNILRHILHSNVSLKHNYELSEMDFKVWLDAYNITEAQFKNADLMKINNFDYKNGEEKTQDSKLISEMNELFKGFILPMSTYDQKSYWNFVPKITLNGISIKWHPLLSDYLFAFMLSSVLRYKPHLFKVNTKDSFIAEAWCNQSAFSSLRYFLMEFSKNNIRLD